VLNDVTRRNLWSLADLIWTVVLKTLNLWAIARFGLLITDVVIMFIAAQRHYTLGIFGGIAIGVIIFVGVYGWLGGKRVMPGSIWAIDRPFYPMARYPVDYWFTMGGGLFAACLLVGAAGALGVWDVRPDMGALVASGAWWLAAYLTTRSEKRKAGQPNR
jgi:hypothetical protein